MSNPGKNNIFQNAHTAHATEAPMGATLLPGTHVIEVDGEFVAATGEGLQSQTLILDRDVVRGGAATEAQEEGALGIARQLVTGDMAVVRAVTGQSITRGAPMTSAGNGQMRLVDAGAEDAEAVLCYAQETITTTENNTLVRVRGA